MHPEITVGREDRGILPLLRHENETRIGQAHWRVIISAEESEYSREPAGKRRFHDDDAALKQAAEGFFAFMCPLKQEQALRNDCFTGDERFVRGTPSAPAPMHDGDRAHAGQQRADRYQSGRLLP